MAEPNVEERTQDIYSQLQGCLDCLKGEEKDMTSSVLESFCRSTAMEEYLWNMIMVEGTIIETPRGIASHPANAEYHKYDADKTRNYAKLIQVLKAHNQASADELAEFVRG